MQGKAAAIAAVAIIVTGCGGSSQTATPVTSTVKITKTVTTIVPSPPFPPKTVMETDGMYRVGIDILPGTYRSGGKSEEATYCFWARLKSLNENDFIDNGMSGGPQEVRVKPDDKAFYTHRCQPWQKV